MQNRSRRGPTLELSPVFEDGDEQRSCRMDAVVKLTSPRLLEHPASSNEFLRNLPLGNRSR